MKNLIFILLFGFLIVGKFNSVNAKESLQERTEVSKASLDNYQFDIVDYEAYFNSVDNVCISIPRLNEQDYCYASIVESELCTRGSPKFVKHFPYKISKIYTERLMAINQGWHRLSNMKLYDELCYNSSCLTCDLS